MLRIRMIEERIALEYPKQQMRCPVHLSIGQEAAAVGVCAAIPKDSLMFSGHRSHAHYLAKGGNLKRMIAELHGKVTGCTRGNGGSMHLIDRSVGFEGATSIVAGTVPVAVGTAWAMKLRNDPRIVVSCIGDAAMEEGVVWESFNFAALHKLNILFVVEDNDCSCYTPKSTRQAFDFTKLAMLFGMGCYLATGQDVESVYREVTEILPLRGPSLITIDVPRFLEHCGPNNDDKLNYRNKPKAEYDPLFNFKPRKDVVSCIEFEIN